MLKVKVRLHWAAFIAIDLFNGLLHLAFAVRNKIQVQAISVNKQSSLIKSIVSVNLKYPLDTLAFAVLLLKPP